MKKLILFLIVCMIALVSVVSATTVTVIAVNDSGAVLSGVIVAPELKLYDIGGWNDFTPETKITSASGSAVWSKVVFNKESFQVNYATLEGYTCTRGASTQKNATSFGQSITLTTRCTKDNEVPEFTTIGAALALLGAAGIFMIRRRN